MKEQTETERPADPGPIAERRPPLRWRPIVATALILGLAFAAFSLPLPIFYAYEPGPVRDVEKLVEVSGRRTYSSEGSLYLTTVSIDLDVTFSEWVSAVFNKKIEIVSRDSVTGGQSFNDLENQQKLEMEQSKQAASEVALGALGFGKPKGDGAEVVQPIEGSPADGVIQAKDLIVAVDGHKVATTCDASEAIAGHQPGDPIELTLKRAGDTETVEIEAGDNPSQPGSAFVGVFMKTANYSYGPGDDVRFKTGNIAGPSAGLMFTLGLYDQLTPEDLTHGELIAGTGTIGCGGLVGPIGGIQQKVAGAEAEGATIFLAPADNAADARAVAGDITIVPVKTFDDAVTYLEDLT